MIFSKVWILSNRKISKRLNHLNYKMSQYSYSILIYFKGGAISHSTFISCILSFLAQSPLLLSEYYSFSLPRNSDKRTSKMLCISSVAGIRQMPAKTQKEPLSCKHEVTLYYVFLCTYLIAKRKLFNDSSYTA